MLKKYKYLRIIYMHIYIFLNIYIIYIIFINCKYEMLVVVLIIKSHLIFTNNIHYYKL